MTKYSTFSHAVLPLCFSGLFLSDNGYKFGGMPVANYGTHKIPIDSQYNDGYPGSCWKFYAKYLKICFPVHPFVYA